MARNTNTRTARPSKPAEPKPEVKTEAKPVPTNCRCGCGAPTITAKAQFVSGHDARLAGRLGRALADGTATDEDRTLVASLSDRLQAKVESVRKTALTKAALKEAREQAKSVAKAAYEQALADLTK